MYYEFILHIFDLHESAEGKYNRIEIKNRKELCYSYSADCILEEKIYVKNAW